MGTSPTADAEFRKVFDATFEDVRRFCLRRLPASDVNDAVSEVYLVAWRKANEVPSGDGALPWLYAVARNVVRHIERSNRRFLRLKARAMREPIGTAPDPEIQVVRRSDYETLAAAIRRLPASDREVIRLQAWEGLTAPAMAQVLGCSVSAAEKRIARAVARLERAFTVRAGAMTAQPRLSERGGL